MDRTPGSPALSKLEQLCFAWVMYWAFYKIPVYKNVLNLKVIISDQHTEAQDIGTANRTFPPRPTPHSSHCPTEASDSDPRVQEVRSY